MAGARTIASVLRSHRDGQPHVTAATSPAYEWRTPCRTLRAMMTAAPAPELATYDDLLAFTDATNKRAELIHGVIVERDVVEELGPSTEHGYVQWRLPTFLGRRFDRAAAGRWPGGWWFAGELDMQYGTNEVFCHDLIGWRRDRTAERPVGRPQRLRPDQDDEE